jgi:hypothetical protein
MEGKLVARILAGIAEADGLDQSATQRLQKLVSGVEQLIDGLGFCLSEQGDLLSQWRGYADDATGVSIGFSKDYLERLGETDQHGGKAGFTLNKVEYEREIQEGLLMPTYKEAKRYISEVEALKFKKLSIFDRRSEDEVIRDNEKLKDAYHALSMTMLPLFGKLGRFVKNANGV